MGTTDSTNTATSRDQDCGQDDAVALAAIVERLRAEVQQLRGRIRTQAVIEQAKGLLSERLSCGLEDAYGHLLELATAADAEPAVTAALLLGTEPPVTPPAPPDSGPAGPVTIFDPATYLGVTACLDAMTAAEPAAAGSARHAPPLSAARHLATAGFAEARTPDELASRLCADALARLGARGVLLAALEPDGALRLIGAHGLPAHIISEWARIPPHVDVALVRAVAAGAPLWDPDTTENTLVGASAGITGPRACVPLYADGRIFGAVEIIWPDGRRPGEPQHGGPRLDDAARGYITAVVTACGHRLRELLGRGSAPTTGDAPWLRAVLDAIPGPAALLSPVRDEHGKVVDFQVDACNSDTTDKTGRRPEDLVGGRLLERYPGLALSGLFDAYVQVIETGTPLRRSPCQYALSAGRVLSATTSIRACRVGGGLLVSWRLHEESADLAAQLAQAQRLGNLGWGEWDLANGTIHWSDQLYTIFGRDPNDGPVDFDEMSTWVLPQDLKILQNLMRRLLDRRITADAVFRIHRRRTPKGAPSAKSRTGEVRHLQVMAEPVLDAFGEPMLLRCVFQDVTRRRRAEQSLAASRQQVERQRRLIEDERHIVVELQRAILPLPQGIVRKAGLDAAVRYLPAGSSTRVGGDWYETTNINDSEVFLAIGDVSGHGQSAAAAMARLRNALSGLAFTGAAPDELLGWLNRVVLHWPKVLTATVLAGRFCPALRTLTWAQAGHLPPVLVHKGKPRLLEAPEGVLLGACEIPQFSTRTTQLAEGDLLMLYTDGLIERRGRDLEDGFQVLLSAAEGCAGAEPDQVIDYVLETLGATNPIDDTCLVVCRIR
jgi:serine phosphatase RsbU (regulator of sigma subunit)